MNRSLLARVAKLEAARPAPKEPPKSSRTSEEWARELEPNTGSPLRRWWRKACEAMKKNPEHLNDYHPNVLEAYEKCFTLEETETWKNDRDNKNARLLKTPVGQWKG